MADKSLMNKTMPLSEAIRKAPNSSGCYQIYYNGKLVYVGKAQDGIRKRFVQYYNGTTKHYKSGKKIYDHRNKITVKWTVLKEKEEVLKKEAYWIRKYKPIWNTQSGWGDKGVLKNNNKKELLMKTPELLETKKPNKQVKDYSKTKSVMKSMKKEALTCGAVTAGFEIAKGILNSESADECVEHTVSKSLESATAGAGGVIGAEIGSAFGPVGTAIGYLGGQIVTGEIIEGAFDEVGEVAGYVTEKISHKARDVAFDVSTTIDSIGLSIECSPLASGVSNFCDNVAASIQDVFWGISSIFGW